MAILTPYINQTILTGETIASGGWNSTANPGTVIEGLQGGTGFAYVKTLGFELSLTTITAAATGIITLYGYLGYGGSGVPNNRFIIDTLNYTGTSTYRWNVFVDPRRLRAATSFPLLSIVESGLALGCTIGVKASWETDAP